MAAANGPGYYPQVSLYVGDLNPEVNEAQLFDTFSACGPVLSIRVCRDIMTRRSLGYAYVNFQNTKDAEEAMKKLNYERLAGRPMRIMWSERNPALRKTGKGNLIVKNLHPDIDSKTLHDTFEHFGPILSCRVCTDAAGKSKGYGFVHFEKETDAIAAKETLHNKIAAGKKIIIEEYDRFRHAGSAKEPVFNNLYVKNFPATITNKETLENLFAGYGKITSAVLPMDTAKNKPKGFGFVCFEKAEDAAKAVAEMNGREVDGMKLYVARHMKKAEREMVMRRRLEYKAAERIVRNQNLNLYVKNISLDLTEEGFIALFRPFGTITSAKLVTDDNGHSKGFGFVCFSAAHEANNAITHMNCAPHGNPPKPLYVAFFQRKAEREAARMQLHFGAVPTVEPRPLYGYTTAQQQPAARQGDSQQQKTPLPKLPPLIPAGLMGPPPPYIMPVLAQNYNPPAMSRTSSNASHISAGGRGGGGGGRGGRRGGGGRNVAIQADIHP